MRLVTPPRIVGQQHQNVGTFVTPVTNAGGFMQERLPIWRGCLAKMRAGFFTIK
jgi:hypothetical protein